MQFTGLRGSTPEYQKCKINTLNVKFLDYQDWFSSKKPFRQKTLGTLFFKKMFLEVFLSWINTNELTWHLGPRKRSALLIFWVEVTKCAKTVDKTLPQIVFCYLRKEQKSRPKWTSLELKASLQAHAPCREILLRGNQQKIFSKKQIFFSFLKIICQRNKCFFEKKNKPCLSSWYRHITFT